MSSQSRRASSRFRASYAARSSVDARSRSRNRRWRLTSGSSLLHTWTCTSRAGVRNMRWPGSRTRSSYPAARSGGENASSSSGSASVTSTSTIGFAARPKTAVEPMCSTRIAVRSSAETIRSRSASNRLGHSGSYSAITIPRRSRPPAELWRASGRYGIEELFKLKDRREADLVLAMTSEEVVTTHVAREVRSYRDLPLILYHLQTKERDEPRPRAGVLRTREFIMKDSYSFDRDEEGLQHSYDKHIQAYDRIFDRCGLEWYRVESDGGMVGGTGAREYMAPCPAGEDDVALSDAGYAANVQIASANPKPV